MSNMLVGACRRANGGWDGRLLALWCSQGDESWSATGVAVVVDSWTLEGSRNRQIQISGERTKLGTGQEKGFGLD